MATASAKEMKMEENGEVDLSVGPTGDSKSKKKIIIIGVIALILLLAIVGAYFGGLFGGSKHEEKAEVKEDASGKPIDKPVFYNLPEFLVNLSAGATKQTSFLKATIILEVVHPTDVPEIEANLPRLLDGFNTYLRELRASDLSGSAGIQRLREELLLRANKAVAPIKINDILFKEIIVQ